MNKIPLEGCRPIPLAAYLKALGVLRLVAEQADPAARGWWDGDRFCLKSTLDRDGLTRFFAHEYSPTPIIAPWNGGSGFYPKDAKEGISALRASTAARFAAYREAIALGARLIRDRKFKERPAERAKGELITALRAEAGVRLVGWIDAAIALTLDKMAFPPLLGTGGNDGRLDFTNNLMQRLSELLPIDRDQPVADSVGALEDALFGAPIAGLSSAAIGQFAPGAAGGPNSSAGFQGDALVNGWDFVLMLEGTPVFAGGVSRRFESTAAGYLSYPFTVRAAAAGHGTASLGEQKESRGELWVPLWGRPARYSEVRALFREGRLSLGVRPARDGVDAARAVASLGVDRGIASFERYGFVKRQGLAYLATPLGRRPVEWRPAGELLSELDRARWLERLRGRAASDDTPAELRAAVRRLEDSVFALSEQPGRAPIVQDALISFGAAVRAIAVRPKLQEALRPPPQLSSRWVEAADDPSPEFRLAVALAGMRARLVPGGDDGGAMSGGSGSATHARFGFPMRAHLGPLNPESRPLQWSAEKGGALAVWSTGRLVDNLCAVAQRRLLEQTRVTVIEAPFDGGFDSDRDTPVAVDRGEIAAFLDGDVRDERIAQLLLGLAWVQPGRWSGARHHAPVPFAYAALKPFFTPPPVFEWLRTHDRLKGEISPLPMPRALPSLLMTGRVQEAVRLAQERARSSGLPAPFLQRRSPQLRAPDRDLGCRLLAALIIPARAGVVGACLDQAYSPCDEETHNAA
jgi:CRISPR-associated protein Csx17